MKLIIFSSCFSGEDGFNKADGIENYTTTQILQLVIGREGREGNIRQGRELQYPPYKKKLLGPAIGNMLAVPVK